MPSFIFAYEKFRKGDRVRTTVTYQSRFIDKKVEFGIVTGFSRDGLSVKVQKDGQKGPQFYSMDFWELNLGE